MNGGIAIIKVTIVQPTLLDRPGLILQWIALHHYKAQIIKTFEGQRIPRPEDIDFLIILGGLLPISKQMSPLISDKQVIKQLLRVGKPVIGFGNGAQEIACALGSQVVTTKKVGGWENVRPVGVEFGLTMSSTGYRVLNWYETGFMLPRGASLLFQSDLWCNQGFIFKSALGFQFHLEIMKEDLRGIVANNYGFLNDSILKQSADRICRADIRGQNRQLLFSVLNFMDRRFNCKIG